MANKQRWFTGVYLDVSMAGPVQLLVVSLCCRKALDRKNVLSRSLLVGMVIVHQ